MSIDYKQYFKDTLFISIGEVQQRLGLTWDELAKEIGCSRITLFRWRMQERPISRAYQKIICDLIRKKERQEHMGD